jgi:hypothetical protein
MRVGREALTRNTVTVARRPQRERRHDATGTAARATIRSPHSSLSLPLSFSPSPSPSLSLSSSLPPQRPGGSADCASDAGGYRVPLLWSLSQVYWPDSRNASVKAQLNVSTVGTLKTGPAYVPASWQNHEGHPGWRIDQLDEPTERAKWVATNPDIITIHLGTNDCYQNYQPATLATKMRSLLVCVQVRGIRSLGPQWHGMVWCGVA